MTPVDQLVGVFGRMPFFYRDYAFLEVLVEGTENRIISGSWGYDGCWCLMVLAARGVLVGYSRKNFNEEQFLQTEDKCHYLAQILSLHKSDVLEAVMAWDRATPKERAEFVGYAHSRQRRLQDEDWISDLPLTKIAAGVVVVIVLLRLAFR